MQDLALALAQYETDQDAFWEMGDLLESKAVTFRNVHYLNLNPHTLNFGSGMDEDENYTFSVPSSGYVLNAVPEEIELKNFNGIKQIRTVFRGTSERAQDMIIRLSLAGYVVVGSMISMQAYRYVHSVISANGYDRVAPADKRMNPLRFNVQG